MAKKRNQPKLTHCKVTLTSHPKAPWRVSYPVEDGGITRRKRRMFSTEQKAYDFASDHEKDVADYGVRFGAITAEARRAFDHYRDARHELQSDGIEFPSFEMLVQSAVANLRRDHENRLRNRITVAEAKELFLAYKSARVGSKHQAGLKGELKRFSESFGTSRLDDLSSAEIETWIQSLPTLGAVSRNKLRKSIKALFAFGCAPDRAWCVRNPLSGIEPEKVKTAEPRAFSTADTAAIFEAALAMNSPALPCLALGFFAGLRPSETMALDLGDINFGKDQFRVPMFKPDGEKTKTGARIAPLTAACKAWLTAQPRRTGPAWKGSTQEHSIEMRAIYAAAKVVGIYDGARHSFITYRCAEIQDVARVADECGNSPNVIKKHYRELVTTEAATKYFAIRPPSKAANVTDFEAGRASA